MKFSDFFYIARSSKGGTRALLYVLAIILLLNTVWLIVMPFVFGTPMLLLFTWPVAAVFAALQFWHGSSARKKNEFMRNSFPNFFKD